MQLLGHAVDQVRRDEQPSHPELEGTRYVWLKNDWNRSEKQARVFDALRCSHLATVRAAHLRRVFQDLFACDSVEEAEPLLKHWYFWATHSRVPAMIKAAKTIKKHWAGVLWWFTSRISNGLLEAINGLIQSAKRKARGFRSTAYLITMVYLIAGTLDFKLPAIAQVTHTEWRGGEEAPCPSLPASPPASPASRRSWSRFWYARRPSRSRACRMTSSVSAIQ